MRGVFQTVTIGNQNNGKSFGFVLSKLHRPGSSELMVAIFMNWWGDADASCPQGGALVSGTQDCSWGNGEALIKRSLLLKFEC